MNIGDTATAVAYNNAKLIQGFHVYVPPLDWNEYILIKSSSGEIYSTDYYYIYATINPVDPEPSQSAAFTNLKTSTLIQVIFNSHTPLTFS